MRLCCRSDRSRISMALTSCWRLNGSVCNYLICFELDCLAWGREQVFNQPTFFGCRWFKSYQPSSRGPEATISHFWTFRHLLRADSLQKSSSSYGTSSACDPIHWTSECGQSNKRESYLCFQHQTNEVITESRTDQAARSHVRVSLHGDLTAAFVQVASLFVISFAYPSSILVRLDNKLKIEFNIALIRTNTLMRKRKRKMAENVEAVEMVVLHRRSTTRI